MNIISVWGWICFGFFLLLLIAKGVTDAIADLHEETVKKKPKKQITDESES